MKIDMGSANRYLNVPCPRCGSPFGVRCVNRGGRVLSPKRSHKLRVYAFERMETERIRSIGVWLDQQAPRS